MWLLISKGDRCLVVVMRGWVGWLFFVCKMISMQVWVENSEAYMILMGGWNCGGSVEKLLHSYEDLVLARAVLSGNKLFPEYLNYEKSDFLRIPILSCDWSLCSLTESELVAFLLLGNS